MASSSPRLVRRVPFAPRGPGAAHVAGTHVATDTAAPDTAARHADASDADALLTREWLVTNGLGGYASGTLGGVTTRRYHGLLVAALPAPLGRVVIVSQLGERLRFPDGRVVWLTGEEREGGALYLEGAGRLREFRLEMGLPVWRYDLDGVVLEKRLLMPRFQNTVHVAYRLLEAPGTMRFTLRPLMAGRPHEAPVDHPLPADPVVTARTGRLEVALAPDLPPIALRMAGRARAAFTLDALHVQHLHYRLEGSRGYQATGDTWSPGYFRIDLSPGDDAVFVASTESPDVVEAFLPDEALAAEMGRRSMLLDASRADCADPVAAQLVLAADQFIIQPATRVADTARAHAASEEARSVIAGYHWFTDWGRDTMIALEGLTLVTGREAEARDILRTFARHFRDGLIPNLFPEGDQTGLYHTADATLWFFHALDRYERVTGDTALAASLLDALDASIEAHRAGTAFNIHVDPADGLLVQGAEGYQLTWMDAKVGDWVVTPRRGKAVEINALWYNALRLHAAWLDAAGEGERASRAAREADRVAAAFNARFWNPATGCLFDVVDGETGDDGAVRPNQVLAVSLPHAVLAPDRWAAVIDTVARELLTPVGLRSLAPGHREFCPRYFGDLRARDAAYHQGTVWAWLIGPFVDAWLRVHPGRLAEARALVEGFVPHLDEAGIGTVSEIFDATEPYTPRGCIAQAWSVAEVLRVWHLTGAEGERRPALTETGAQDRGGRP
ncbi:MAG: glycogen debranching enzyme N-terminal domain-containing protein [Vicinamibacteraceae bacterium]|nr:glycogen debranching enzyme N-terminal domain-containing protein [Vicinamibacteraceae bacterium]